MACTNSYYVCQALRYVVTAKTKWWTNQATIYHGKRKLQQGEIHCGVYSCPICWRNALEVISWCCLTFGGPEILTHCGAKEEDSEVNCFQYRFCGAECSPFSHPCLLPVSCIVSNGQTASISKLGSLVLGGRMGQLILVHFQRHLTLKSGLTGQFVPLGMEQHHQQQQKKNETGTRSLIAMESCCWKDSRWTRLEWGWKEGYLGWCCS